MHNTSMKLPKAAKETGIAAYNFYKEWKPNEGTVLPGYKLASEIKKKSNNIKLTEEHSQFIEDYIQEHLTCIVKDVTELLLAKFIGRPINCLPPHNRKA